MSSESCRQLIEELRCEGISNESVLAAIATVPREQFVPAELVGRAYLNTALPIHCEQTISQPYVVARMTELLLETKIPKNVLEVGTGSGYQAAVLATLIETVYSIERVEDLYQDTKSRLSALGYRNIQLRYGDGYQGWPEAAPFDAIIVTAAAEAIPENLVAQLAIGGVMVIPVGQGAQELLRITRSADGVDYERHEGVIFVPMLPGTKGES